MELKVIPWTKDTPPSEEQLQQELEKQDLRVYRWSNGPGAVYEGHTHSFHKILYVVEGNIKFDLPTHQQTFNLKPGDRLELPSGIRHRAVVGPDGVTCLEAHIY
ncbi:MAG: cupin domain-containing protein [Chloroflexi bacterium]|nr:MAG: cupin domain-containing protein [Chloroflexota bacterium]